jgi:uncharacterized NAD-dependent epimerase/dehydratase family protein
MRLNKPYLLVLGEAASLGDAKTAAGLRDWCPNDVAGQFALEGCGVDLGIPWYTPEAAVAAGARSLVIGVAPVGGAIPASWWPTLQRAVESGLDVVSGMHTPLAEVPGLAAAAARLGRALIDVRHGERRFPAGTGRKRSGLRLLTVGTDCALGKKYTALALTRALTERGADATFRATGQTGILISGEGIAIDAVVADFIAGAAEALSPDAAADHWDVIEGQGALFHPAYAGVTLGLVHGSQPDALVLCHDPTRTSIEDFPDFPLPSLPAALDQYLTAARVTNRAARFVGVSLNTSRVAADRRAAVIGAAAAELGLPVIDPMQGGAGVLADALLREFPPGAGSTGARG